MPFSLLNPYPAGGGVWVRGNLHGHCKERSGCSSVPLLKGARLYHEVGARFMAVTDHDNVTNLDELKTLYPDMTFLEGFEYSSSENVLFIGETVPPLYRFPIEGALERAYGLLTVICHPRPWKNAEYWTIAKIMSLSPMPWGIEVYNGHYSRAHVTKRDTNPLYSDVWDELLTRGIRLWGFANDDFHDPQDFNKAFNMVNVDALSASTLLDALKAGRSYATTGLLLEKVSVEAEAIEVRLKTAANGRFVGPRGEVLGRGQGRAFAYRSKGEGYVRFEADGAAGRIFLQPFFADGGLR